MLTSCVDNWKAIMPPTLGAVFSSSSCNEKWVGQSCWLPASISHLSEEFVASVISSHSDSVIDWRW